MKNLHISISGIIAAGKTPLAEQISTLMDMPLYKEHIEDNRYLERFYASPSQHSFSLQMYLLNNKFRQQQQIIWGDGGIHDRSIYKDEIFASLLNKQHNISTSDLNIYRNSFKTMMNFMRSPNLIVHLDVKPEIAYKRIKMRNRECERNITLTYLTQLYDEYRIWLGKIKLYVRVLELDWNTVLPASYVVERIKARPL